MSGCTVDREDELPRDPIKAAGNTAVPELRLKVVVSDIPVLDGVVQYDVGIVGRSDPPKARRRIAHDLRCRLGIGYIVSIPGPTAYGGEFEVVVSDSSTIPYRAGAARMRVARATRICEAIAETLGFDTANTFVVYGGRNIRPEHSLDDVPLADIISALWVPPPASSASALDFDHDRKATAKVRA